MERSDTIDVLVPSYKADGELMAAEPVVAIVPDDAGQATRLLVGDVAAVAVAAGPGWSRRVCRRMVAALIGLWGATSLLVGLAILATIPVLNLLSLGYLLEASGRVARTRRLSAGLIGLRPAAICGTIALAGWLLRWPILLVASMWYDSSLMDPASRATKLWGLAWFAMVGGIIALAMAAGVVLAIARPRLVIEFRDGLWMIVMRRLPQYFWLGLRGFAGSMIWLVLPVSILACGAFVRPEPGAAISLLGGLLLTPVVMLLPFLQTHFAAENRFAALFEVRTVRQLFVRAPLAFWLALLATLLFAVPLYLLMIEALPREVTWLPSILFVLFLFPARLLCGWAYARAAERQDPRWWLFRWLARAGMLPLALMYAFFVWLSQYLLWHGVFSLYHQHAFLVPVPFFGG